MRWQRMEIAYRSSKFEVFDDRQLLRTEGVGRGTIWYDQIVEKLHRAQVLGLATPAGRQAVAKAAAASLALTETVVLEYGLLPMPGVPSGDALDLPFAP